MNASKIVKVKKVGKLPTIDIEIDNDSHVYYANGIATSNSHAVAYASNGFHSAFCKTHFPLQFFCSYLDGAKNKQKPLDEIRILVNDARKFNISVLPPSLRDMQPRFYIQQGSVRFGLGEIKQVGNAALNKLLETLKGYDTAALAWYTYLTKITPHVSSAVSTALISAGALDYFNVPRQRMLFELKIWDSLTAKEQQWIVDNLTDNNLLDALKKCAPPRKAGGGCHSIKRTAVLTDLITSLENPPHSLRDTSDWIAWNEEKYLGVALTATHLDACMDASRATCTCKELAEGFTGYILLACEIQDVVQKKVKNGPNAGKDMAIITVSDDTGTIEGLPVYSNVWEIDGPLCHNNNTVLLHCERFKEGNLSVKKIYQI